MERIEVKHNKAVTAVFSLLNLITIAALSGCIALLWVNNAEISESVGLWIVIVATVLLSLFVLWLVVLLICSSQKAGAKSHFHRRRKRDLRLFPSYSFGAHCLERSKKDLV